MNSTTDVVFAHKLVEGLFHAPEEYNSVIHYTTIPEK